MGEELHLLAASPPWSDAGGVCAVEISKTVPGHDLHLHLWGMNTNPPPRLPAERVARSAQEVSWPQRVGGDGVTVPVVRPQR